MTNEELLAYNKNRKIFQLGIVVKDIDEAVKQWEEVYKVGPWKIVDFGEHCLRDIINEKGSAKPGFAYRAAMTFVGDLQIEFIEANESVPIFNEFLKKTGGGLHHIKEQVSDDILPDMLKEYADRGMPAVFGAHYYNANFYFMDTVEQLGVQIELGNCTPVKIPDNS